MCRWICEQRVGVDGVGILSACGQVIGHAVSSAVPAKGRGGAPIIQVIVQGAGSRSGCDKHKRRSRAGIDDVVFKNISGIGGAAIDVDASPLSTRQSIVIASVVIEFVSPWTVVDRHARPIAVVDHIALEDAASSSALHVYRKRIPAGTADVIYKVIAEDISGTQCRSAEYALECSALKVVDTNIMQDVILSNRVGEDTTARVSYGKANTVISYVVDGVALDEAGYGLASHRVAENPPIGIRHSVVLNDVVIALPENADASRI